MYILFEPKKAQTRRKHEKKTKKTRKIHAILRIFVQTEDKSSGENSPLIYEKSVV